jgi:Protein of unknown function (DUF3800)
VLCASQPVHAPYSAIRHFAMAMFLGRWRESYLSMFTVYFDESGSPDDTAALVVAGFVAPSEQWIEFERNWNEVLSRFGVSSLHMKHFAHSVKEYASWKGDENKRRSLLSRLINVIRTRVNHSFADAVLMQDYRNVNKRYYLNEVFKPYAIAGRTCVTKVGKWAERSGISKDQIAYVFEDGACDKGELVHRLKTDLISNYGFQPKSASVAFQAADLLAYEHLLVNTKISAGSLTMFHELRHPLKELNKVPNDDGKDWGVYEEKDLERFCISTKVPRRPEPPS